MSQRLNKAASELKKIISSIIQRELRDPRIGFASVTGVEVTADLQHATVFFTVLGDEERKQKTLEGLNSSAGYIRKLIGKSIKMRYTPDITFKVDESISYGEHIDRIIDKIHKEKKDEPE